MVIQGDREALPALASLRRRSLSGRSGARLVTGQAENDGSIARLARIVSLSAVPR
jgi:hypothetical protein